MSQDVISLITNDHRQLESLFTRIRMDTANRPELTQQLYGLLVAHSRAEEERIYPVIAQEATQEKGQIRHSEEEHHQAEEIARRLSETPADEDSFEDTLDQLVEAVTEHVQLEESEVLPALRAAVSKQRMTELGAEFRNRRAEVLREFGAEDWDLELLSRDEVYREAQEEEIPGRSKMNKGELTDAVREEIPRD